MDEPAKQPRQLKNAESFRERALKASEARENPKQSLPRLKRASSNKTLGSVVKVIRRIGQLIIPKYLRTSFDELRKVTWPGFKQSRRLTYAVLIFAAVFGASVAVVDWGLTKLFRVILLK